MPWVLKSNGELYTGETHELVGRTFTGKTRTASSMPLLFVEEAPKKVEEKKPRRSAAAIRAAKFKKGDSDA